MSSDSMEKGPIFHAPMPLQNTKYLTPLVDVVERSDGRWGTRKLPVPELFDVSRLVEPVKYLKVNLNESQKRDHPELLLM
jgi:hypothetical protein